MINLKSARKIADGIWFAPDVGDNRDHPDDTRTEVLISAATQNDLNRLQRAAKKKHTSRDDDDPVVLRHATDLLFLERVLDLRNWQIEEEPIGSVEALLEALRSEVFSAVGTEIMGQITLAIMRDSTMEDGARKNSSSPSDSL